MVIFTYEEIVECESLKKRKRGSIIITLFLPMYHESDVRKQTCLAKIYHSQGSKYFGNSIRNWIMFHIGIVFNLQYSSFIISQSDVIITASVMSCLVLEPPISRIWVRCLPFFLSRGKLMPKSVGLRHGPLGIHGCLP